jgi:hypothetical protein
MRKEKTVVEKPCLRPKPPIRSKNGSREAVSPPETTEKK